MNVALGNFDSAIKVGVPQSDVFSNPRHANLYIVSIRKNLDNLDVVAAHFCCIPTMEKVLFHKPNSVHNSTSGIIYMNQISGCSRG
jgi:hypothetical protein